MTLKDAAIPTSEPAPENVPESLFDAAQVLEEVEERTRRLPAYPEYTPCRNHWIKQLPAHWNERKLKFIADVRNSNVDKKTVEGQDDVRLCNYVDVYYHDYIRDGIDFMSASASRDQIRRFKLKRGDVIITKDSEAWDDIAVPTCVDEDFDDVVCGYHLALIRPVPEIADGDYLFRAFSSQGLRDQFRVRANGVTRFGIPRDGLTSALFPVPPLNEQQAIAAFLRRETAKIDALVAKKRRLIELLREKRTALVSHAVTKGLNSDAPFKPSGIDWLGDLPASWTLVPLKHVTTEYCDGPFGSGLKSEHYCDRGVRVVRLQNIASAEFLDADSAFISDEHYATLSDHDVLPGDVLVAGLGDQAHPVGRACVAPDHLGPAMVKADCFRFRIDERRASPVFVAFALTAISLLTPGRDSTGTTRARMNLSTTSRRVLPLPPLKEQLSIIACLDEALSQVLQPIARIECAIDRLNEYRCSLISAAVTGKIDVRDN